MDPHETDSNTAQLFEFASAVFQLARGGDAATLQNLLRRGLPRNLRNDKGDSLLMLAAYNGNEPAVVTLLQHGADPNIVNDRGQTPLAAVAYTGHISIAKHLLDHGARDTPPVPGGRTALMTAAMFDRIDILNLLLEHGADPFAADESGMTALDFSRHMHSMRTLAVLERLHAERATPPADRNLLSDALIQNTRGY